ncbi:MAG TPA: hypothetical protein DCS31_03405 [Candidatus Competibacteraceae bacterium]|nr:hypothetical protein [Candidatus Competibacter denitrificans]HAS85829.1 hypothetical protein [Candidatus Competibacteraceae bacterium]HRC70512.1 hypothetical protein [Candidatus Competibacter denitrificans]
MINTVAMASATGDAETILQILLNTPQLSQYYHFDVRPQRKPLQINNHTHITINPKAVVVDGEAIQIASGPNALDITEFLVETERAQIAFAFPVEGIRGSAIFNKDKNDWRLNHINVAEH